MRYASLLSILALCAVGQTAMSQTTVPNTFTVGTPAKAAEVNADFQALATAIDALATRVGKLEGGATVDTDIVGTYKVSFLQVGVGWTGGPATIEAISYEATLMFAADHTGTLAVTGHKNDHTGPHLDSGTFTGTWSLANNDVTLSGLGAAPLILHCSAGCRLLVGTGYGSAVALNDEGDNFILIAVHS
ncbi:MAG: hypothetical protein WDO68_17575 [Gammaproteobacteria bacterium]